MHASPFTISDLMVWPANAFRLALAAVQAPFLLLAAPSDWKPASSTVP